MFEFVLANRVLFGLTVVPLCRPTTASHCSNASRVAPVSSLANQTRVLSFSIPAMKVVPAYDHHDFMLMRHRRDRYVFRTDHVLVSNVLRQAYRTLYLHRRYHSAVPVRTRSKVRTRIRTHALADFTPSVHQERSVCALSALVIRDSAHPCILPK